MFCIEKALGEFGETESVVFLQARNQNPGRDIWNEALNCTD